MGTRMFSLFLVLLFAIASGFAQSGDSVVKREEASLKKLEKSYLTSKAAYQKSPKDGKKKKTYAAAATDYGYEVMVSPALAPRVKYPKALKLFRETLKVEPGNAKAKKWSKTIEDIYRSMGRPVPKV